MSSLFNNTVFRLKVAQIVFSIVSIVPLFGESVISSSPKFFYDFVYLTWYAYLGIGIVTLLSLWRQEPMSEKVALFSSCLAVILHMVSSIIVFWEAIYANTHTVLLLLSGLFTLTNFGAFLWEVLIGFGYAS